MSPRRYTVDPSKGVLEIEWPLFGELSRAMRNRAVEICLLENDDVVEQSVRYNPVTKGWRLVLRLRVKDTKQSTEMRAALVSGDKTLTETWSYQLPANE